jgi:ribonuclease HII
MHKEFDDKLRKKHGLILVAIDEVARGSWCGPLVAAAVAFPPDFDIPELTDSKKLTAEKREELDCVIKENALAWSIQSISAEQIDRNGITWANIQAMERAGKDVENKLNKIDLFILDQSPCKTLNPHIMIPRADSTSMSVAGASVIAKVYRDSLIKELHNLYPQYGFDKHKGYIDKLHVENVKKYGIIKGVYRESFVVKGFNKTNQTTLS